MQWFCMSICGLALMWQIATISALFCSTELDFNSACKFGNMSLTTSKGINIGVKHCDDTVNVSQLAGPPVINIVWSNKTEVFTVLMLDAGQLGNGPTFYLQWMVSNVTANELENLRFTPSKILAEYEAPSIPPLQKKPQYFQIIAFRHNTSQKKLIPEVHSSYRRTFDLRKFINGALDIVKLCGPVAGLQFRVKFDNISKPNPPPAGFIYPGSFNYGSHPVQQMYNPQPPNPAQPAYPAQPGYPAQPAYPAQPPQNPHQPGWVPGSGWANSGGQVPTNSKKNHSIALRPEALVLFTVFITALINFMRY